MVGTEWWEWLDAAIVRQLEDMSLWGKSIVVKGELRSSEDLTIEGTIDGPLICEGCAIVIEPNANVVGDILARDVTIFGRSAGQIIATDVVDVRPEAIVRGQIVSKRFILNDGARFDGRVEPQHLDAAQSVVRYNQKKRDGAG